MNVRKATDKEIDKFVTVDDMAIKSYIHPEKYSEVQLEAVIELLQRESCLNPIRAITEDVYLMMSAKQYKRYRDSCYKRMNVYVEELNRRRA